jgi:signal transduction histidine kinase
MRERAARHGARLTFGAGPDGAGTRVHVVVPL